MSIVNNVDVIVIGAGNAGLAAASVAKEAGWSVLVVESRDAGGTCPIRGCVPKKVLVAAAEALDVINNAAGHGIEVSKPKLNWSALIEREQGFVEGVSESIEASLKRREIGYVKGHARFVDRHIVAVGDERYEGRKILVATGSTPRTLAIPGAEFLITSEHLLSSPELPESIVFIGGGVIAMELAHVLVRAGTKVTILERGERPLPALDADAVEHLVTHSEALGIKFLRNAVLTAVTKSDAGLVVQYEQAGVSHELIAEAVANTSGRVANIEGLGLDCAQVESDGNRVMLDEQGRSTSNPSIFFAGDVLPSTPQLSPLATREGRVVGRQIVGLDAAPLNYMANPSAVFTLPALAQVGRTEAMAKSEGLDFRVVENDMSTWRSARTYLEKTTYAKVLIENGSNRILGAHLLGHGSQETIHAFAFAIQHGLASESLADAAYAYPTFHSDLKYLL
tara:strand:+ start:40732 stop:42087 length:1356 start_codon:yes stop_codon:yes gene_type:complete